MLADRFDAFLLDLDGVVWRGEHPIPGAAETIARMRADGKRVIFVTNNASRAPRDYAVKLMRMLIPTEPSDVVTSAHAVVDRLRSIGLQPGDRVHVCAAPGLHQFLVTTGFTSTRETHDVKAVVVAWNPALAFEDLRRASDVARTGLPFIAANRDATYPSEHGLVPGTGAILAAIETASGRTAYVVGKPQPETIRIALEKAGVAAERALFLGDRADTDVAGAREAGVPVALVLTGVTSEHDLASLTHQPDWILAELADVYSTPLGPVEVDPVLAAADQERIDEDHAGDEPSSVGEVGDTPTLPGLA